MRKSDSLVYTLSTRMVVLLFVYYLIWMLGGMAGAGIVLWHTLDTTDKKCVIILSFMVSIAMSGTLCSIQYIRRLYRACLTDRVERAATDRRWIGNMAYFIFRPFFACVFSIVMLFALLSGMVIVTGTVDYVLNERFVYLCAVLSGYLGFSVGKFLDKFEKTSEEAVTSML